MFRTNRWTLVVGFALLLVGCAGRQMGPRSPATADFGCFRVEVEGTLAHPLPALIELRPEPSACAFARGGSVLLGLCDGQAGPRAHGHWSPVNVDRVNATWGTDLFGVVLDLRRSVSGYGGTATTVRDVGDADAPVPVRLTRTPCSYWSRPTRRCSCRSPSVGAARLPLAPAAERQYR
jgi:hypothetical protein